MTPRSSGTPVPRQGTWLAEDSEALEPRAASLARARRRADHTAIHDCPARTGRRALPVVRPSLRDAPPPLGAHVRLFPSRALARRALCQAAPAGASYLLPQEGPGLALAVGLDAADVVGRGAAQDLQELLQGGLRGRGQGQVETQLPGAPAGPWAEAAANPFGSPPSPRPGPSCALGCLLALTVPTHLPCPPLLLTSASRDLP